MELGSFTPKVFGEGDRIKAQDLAGEPLIVVVNEIRHEFKSAYAPEGGTALFCDIANVRTNEVYISVLWMNRQIVDQLGVGDYLCRPLPIKISWIPSPKGGNPFLMPEPLEGSELLMAENWASANDGRFARELEIRKAKAAVGDGNANAANAIADVALSPVAAESPVPAPPQLVTSNPGPQPPMQLVPPTVPDIQPTPAGPSANLNPAGGIEVTPEMIAAVQALQAQQTQK